MHVVIIGCGEIGILSARQLLDTGHKVTAVRRNTAALPPWLQSCSADVTHPDSLHFLQDLACDVVIYQVAAAGFNEQAYYQAYVQGLTNVISAINAVEKRQQAKPQLLFVSSTGVYHQNDGSWVDETSETLPQKFNGQIMLEGERLLAGVEMASAVRFSGIYGPGRTRLIERVRKGETGSSNDGYTNRIHVADCAAVLAHLASLGHRVKVDGGQALYRTYLASDCAPVLRSEVFGFLASELGSPAAAGSSSSDFTDATSKRNARIARIAGSKRCNNQRLLDTGYQFLYPDYQAGYRQVIAQLPV